MKVESAHGPLPIMPCMNKTSSVNGQVKNENEQHLPHLWPPQDSQILNLVNGLSSESWELFQGAMGQFYFEINLVPNSGVSSYFFSLQILKMVVEDVSGFLPQSLVAQSTSSCIPGLLLCPKGHFLWEGVSMQSSGVAMAVYAVFVKGRSISSPYRNSPSPSSDQSIACLHQNLPGIQTCILKNHRK